LRPGQLRAGIVLASAALLAQCGPSSDLTPLPGPPDGFAYAYASPDCAPWDGAAVQILLTTVASDTPETAQPRLRLAIYPREPDLAGKTYRWPAQPEMATGGRCDADTCELAPAGEVHLGPARPDSVLEGTVTLHFGPNETLTGGFRAAWRPRRVLCG
jgi:hypothetical protein